MRYRDDELDNCQITMGIHVLATGTVQRTFDEVVAKLRVESPRREI